jgi:CheY-specific phosphatase CheX
MFPSKSNQLDRLTIELSSAAEDIVGALCGPIALEASEFPFSGFELAGIIGFGGDARGHLMIAATRGCMKALHPLRDRGVALDEADWIAELSNQLLGRFKNRLLSCGVTILIGTPVVATSGELKKSSEGEQLSLKLRTKHDEISLLVDWRAPPTLRVLEPMIGAETPADSEVILF